MTLGGRVGMRTGWSRRTRQEQLVYKLLLPVFGTVFVLATIPFVMAVIEALTAGPRGFVGLANFETALGNPLLFESIKQTAFYAAIALPTEILGGLGIALLVHRVIRSPGLRAAIYVAAMIPIVIPQIAVGVVFRLVYQPDYGILNVLLATIDVGDEVIVTDPTYAGLINRVRLAGGIPRFVEAAQVDGASTWSQFRHIELPYLRPLLLLVLFFRLADVIRVFDHVYVLTGGGPGTTTQYLSLYIYRIGFQFTDLSQASALAVLVMAAMTIFYTIVSRFLPADRG